MAKKTTKSADATSDAQDKTQGNWTEVKPAAATATETEPTPKRTRKPKAEAPPVEPTAEPATAPKNVRKPKAAAPSPEVEPAASAVEATVPPKKAKRSKSDATLQDVFKGYLDSLEKADMSEGTIASYRMELVLAGDDLGIETRVADLKPERVLLFFTSDRVVKKRNGRPKSPLSIDKTRRVLRQALTWAETNKLVAQAPVPELAASH